MHGRCTILLVSAYQGQINRLKRQGAEVGAPYNPLLCYSISGEVSFHCYDIIHSHFPSPVLSFFRYCSPLNLKTQEEPDAPLLATRAPPFFLIRRGKSEEPVLAVRSVFSICTSSNVLGVEIVPDAIRPLLQLVHQDL